MGSQEETTCPPLHIQYATHDVMYGEEESGKYILGVPSRAQNQG